MAIPVSDKIIDGIIYKVPAVKGWTRQQVINEVNRLNAIFAVDYEKNPEKIEQNKIIMLSIMAMFDKNNTGMAIKKGEFSSKALDVAQIIVLGRKLNPNIRNV